MERYFTSRNVLLLALIAILGCGDGRPARVLVTGNVVIDGKPLKYGSVRFIPSGARPSRGSLDQNGRFTLTCFDPNDGVVPGIHRVEVAGCEELGPSKIFWHAPKKYADANTSGLTKEISEPTDSLVIELTWDGAKPFLQTFENDDSESNLKSLHAAPK